MITLLSTQLNYIYSIMDDSQRRGMDYCTQNYLEKILLLKPFFSSSLDALVEEQIKVTTRKIDIPLMKEAVALIKQILKGENIDDAVGQLEAATRKVTPELQGYTYFYRIVSSRVLTHKVRSTQYRKFQEKCGARLVTKTSLLEEELK